MILFKNENTDPYFNLACEEYLLETESDVIMLWRNEPSVIIGRNQNAYAELNLGYIKTNNIKAVRRLTGGGAVFHDLGNVNFTFITPKSENVLNFKHYTQPIINSLSKLGISAELCGRNDVEVNGLKISGNAQCCRNDKILHHGTLLFSADLTKLAGSLNVDEEKIKSKGIKSVRSRVVNIQELLDREMDVLEFKSFIESCFDAEVRELPNTNEIQKLADTKYSTWDWNFGKSKEYSFKDKKRYDFGTVEINLNVDGGYITDIKIFGDFFSMNDISELEQSLIGTKFEDLKDIRELLEGN
ncbi:MAG: lipoate--protein ligase [Oscillospiraceae bacterium]|nr:lipoate--protein ligase [Oscillospiraceae bacterium]